MNNNKKITKSEVIREAIEYFYQMYSNNESRLDFLRNPNLEHMKTDDKYCTEMLIKYIMQD